MEFSPAESALLSWRFEPIAAISLALSAFFYWRGWKRLSIQLPHRFPAERMWSFFAGLSVVYIAIASPLDAFAGWLLTVHMVQHLLLTMVAPPLILLGNPLLPVLSGLPRGVAGSGLGPFLTDPPLQRVGRFLVYPLFAGPLFMLSNILWHTPALYEMALRSRGWHVAEHVCFLATAILFWWPVIQPWPMRPAWPRWAMAPYLLAADLQNTALSGFLSFSEGVLYPTYAAAPRISSLSAVDDQAAAGRWPRLLRSKWLAVGLLATYFWAYEFFHLWNSPWWTAWIILAYFAGAVLVDGFFRGASFCKYVCPIGQFHFVSSLVSPLEVRVREPDICASCRTRDCLRGNELQHGCELQLFQPRKSGNMDCTFCLDCIKACPRDNVGMVAVTPGADLLNDPRRSSVGQYSRRPDLAALVLVFVFAAFANSGGMVIPVLRWEQALHDSFGTSAGSVFMTLLFFGAVLLVPFLLAFACAFLGTRLAGMATRWREVICGFSISLAPLGFGMWLAHFVFHFLAGSYTVFPVIERIARDLGASKVSPRWNVSSLAFVGLPGLQILFLNAGCLLALWLFWRKSKALSAHRTIVLFLPWFFLALALYAIGIWIIFQPMEMRGTLIR